MDLRSASIEIRHVWGEWQRDLIALSLFQTPVPRSLKLFCFNVLKNLKRAFEKKNLDEHQPL